MGAGDQTGGKRAALLPLSLFLPPLLLLPLCLFPPPDALSVSVYPASPIKPKTEDQELPLLSVNKKATCHVWITLDW